MNKKKQPVGVEQACKNMFIAFYGCNHNETHSKVTYNMGITFVF